MRKLKPNNAPPENRWRLTAHTPASTNYEYCRSEAATQSAVEAAKETTTGDLLVVERLNVQTGSWKEWLRWVRRGGHWRAE